MKIANGDPGLCEDIMPHIAIIGAGQLARMTIQSAISLNINVRILASDHNSPANAYASEVIYSTSNDYQDFLRLGNGVSVITCENEGANIEALTEVMQHGVVVRPQPNALKYVQDKLLMRQKLLAMNIDQPAFVSITCIEDFWDAARKWDYHIVLKVRKGGYDGRGVWICSSLSQCQEVGIIILDLLKTGHFLMAEEKIAWHKELSAQVARSPFGQIATWPVVRTFQHNGQCAFVVAPDPQLSPHTAHQAMKLAVDIAVELEVVGLLAVELFVDYDSRLYVNELAMRPHNSGHWTMNGSITSQFEQHIRAVLDYPLGKTHVLAPVTVMANILGAEQTSPVTMDERIHHLMARMPEAKIHLYGKISRPHRKLGHINILGSDTSEEAVAALLTQARIAAQWLSSGKWEDNWNEHHGT